MATDFDLKKATDIDLSDFHTELLLSDGSWHKAEISKATGKPAIVVIPNLSIVPTLSGAKTTLNEPWLVWVEDARVNSTPLRLVQAIKQWDA